MIVNEGIHLGRSVNAALFLIHFIFLMGGGGGQYIYDLWGEQGGRVRESSQNPAIDALLRGVEDQSLERKAHELLNYPCSPLNSCISTPAHTHAPTPEKEGKETRQRAASDCSGYSHVVRKQFPAVPISACSSLQCQLAHVAPC